jgi:site-specific recombinase XerD
METKDEREKLINDICMICMPYIDNLDDIKNAIYIAVNKYEVTSRCTELAETNLNRNEFLIKQFIVGKTVKGCSQRTIHYYKTEIIKILEGIGKTVDDITADDIRYYMAIRQGRDKVSKTTAGNELRVLSSFFQYLSANELITKNPVLKVDCVKSEKRKKNAFTEIEVEKIRMAAEGEREKAIIEILLSTGCRISELVQIMISEVDQNKILIHGKGAKDRIVYLNARAQLAVEVYMRERKDTNPYLFPGGHFGAIKGKKREVQKNWWKYKDMVTEDTHIDKCTLEGTMRKIAKKAGVERANPHKFRRTCATMALRHGMPIEQVSKMLGHNQLTTTQIYLDLDEAELEQAHKKYVV